jgi:peptidoglycan/xylan/chitin deacetylase (PgdA/CDA1 family)/SAM-dependent methyltransferase
MPNADPRTTDPGVSGATICPLAPAHFCGLGAFQAAALLSFYDLRLAALPLALFVVLALIAPFCPWMCFYLPVVRKGRTEQRVVALTIDDGPDPHTTPIWLSLLAQHGFRATFFVTGRQAERYPHLIERILADGHEIGNHSYRHDNFLMLRSGETIDGEVERCNRVLARHGIRALAFRPPVGITNPSLFRVLIAKGMFCCGFSARAADFGNRRIGKLADRLLARTRPGDVVLLHDGIPRDGDLDRWRLQVEQLLEGLAARQLAGSLLSVVIGQKVMEVGAGGEHYEAVAGFYDRLAWSYDREQASNRQCRLRNHESEAAKRWIATLDSNAVVLEAGSGTGRFTIPLALRVAQVTAVDLSGEMLVCLQQKAAQQGIDNIRVLRADMTQIDLERRFDALCAFSTLEYPASLESVLQHLCTLLRPGGSFYATLARCSLPRLTVQVGNAMRQGIWLHAYRLGEIRRMLEASGFDRISVRPLGSGYGCGGGMMMEVSAWKAAA